MSAQSKKLLPREIFPLMAAGLLFAMPAFAADQQAAAGKNGTAKSIAAKPAVKQAPRNVAPKVQPKAVVAMSYDSQGRVIRRATVATTDGAAHGFDHTLLDDGTFWREEGSQTTWQQTGMASWYGGPHWQGKRTSSGERYDQNQLTAAHATLPIGTKVRVARTDGRGSVIVTINDRPGSRTRIIDLSRAAAKELGILTAGITMVTLQPL